MTFHMIGSVQGKSMHSIFKLTSRQFLGTLICASLLPGSRALAEDTTPPEVTAVFALDHSRYVLVEFSEPVGAGAETPTNYSVIECEHHVDCQELSVVSAIAWGNRVSIELNQGIIGRYPVWFSLLAANIADLQGNMMDPSGWTFTTLPAETVAFESPKIGMHVAPRSSDQVCTSSAPQTLSCSQFNTRGETRVPSDVYLVASDSNPTARFSEVLLGIEYDESLSLTGWSSCSFTESPDHGWPGSGGGNRIATTERFCEATPSAEGVNFVLGAFYVYAYAPSSMAITSRQISINPGPTLRDCSGKDHPADPGDLGEVAFGEGTGYNPCESAVPVRRTTWGRLKTLMLEDLPPGSR